jgi:hypothetical protein
MDTSQTNNAASLFDNLDLLGAFRPGHSIDAGEQRSQPASVGDWKQLQTYPNTSFMRPIIGFDHDPILFSATKSLDGASGMDSRKYFAKLAVRLNQNPD